MCACLFIPRVKLTITQNHPQEKKVLFPTAVYSSHSSQEQQSASVLISNPRCRVIGQPEAGHKVKERGESQGGCKSLRNPFQSRQRGLFNRGMLEIDQKAVR